MNKGSIATIFICVMILAGGFAMLFDYEPGHDVSNVNADDLACSRQFMTLEERVEYRVEMRVAKTVEERTSIRNRYHELMAERAMERGILIPNAPSVSGAVIAPTGGDVDYSHGSPQHRTWSI